MNGTWTLQARSSKIVAGAEAENTNLLIQVGLL
jgi:hypothetical protein